MPTRLLLFLVFFLSAAAPPPHTTIIVIGDSQAQGLAGGMHRVARDATWAHVLNNARGGSGLLNPVTYNWPAAVPALLTATHPDVAVLMLGGNDRLSMVLADGTSLPFNSDAWLAIYRGRVKALLAALQTAKIPFIWVSNPVAREANYAHDMQILNNIFADVVKQQGGQFMDIWLAVSDGAGHFAPSGPDLSGATVRLRLDDGIHFTPAGYDVIATKVMAAVASMRVAAH